MTAVGLPPRHGSPAVRAGPLPAVSLSRVSKGYGRGRLVLVDVDLVVGEGELVAVTGAPGSGKTTLLKLMAGLEPPSSGSVVVAGTALGGLTRQALARLRLEHVAAAFHDLPLVPTLSLVENVALPLLLAGEERGLAARRAREALGSVGLTEGEGRASDSGPTERGLASLARAIASRASLLLVDEPTLDLGVLEAERALACLRRQASERGRTVIMATREATAAAHADRQYRLRAGALEDD